MLLPLTLARNPCPLPLHPQDHLLGSDHHTLFRRGQLKVRLGMAGRPNSGSHLGGLGWLRKRAGPKGGAPWCRLFSSTHPSDPGGIRVWRLGYCFTRNMRVHASLHHRFSLEPRYPYRVDKGRMIPSPSSAQALVDLHGEETGLGGKLTKDEINVITGAWAGGGLPCTWRRAVCAHQWLECGAQVRDATHGGGAAEGGVVPAHGHRATALIPCREHQVPVRRCGVSACPAAVVSAAACRANVSSHAPPPLPKVPWT